MPEIALKYGSRLATLEYDDGRFDVLAPAEGARGLNDGELGERLDDPVGSEPLEDIIAPNETVLIVVPDATRRSAAGQVVNLLIRRLIASGTMPYDISIIFATGIHRPVTADEKKEILTPFIAQRIKTLDHSPRDLAGFVRLGETSGGIPVELNRSLAEADHIITVGSVGFHYFAGFTGGRKLICPGLASARTITGTHRLAFDFDRLDRAEGVGPGRLEGNPVHLAFIEAATKVNVSFSVSTIVNENAQATHLFSGGMIESHLEACRHYAGTNMVKIAEKRPLVIASCGGYPNDINMIQAHKTLDAAASACAQGGTIVLLAECRDGMGRDDFLSWFEAADSQGLAKRLAENYKVNGQTAWSLLRKTESMDVRLVTAVSSEDVEKLRARKYTSLQDAIGGLDGMKGYIMPRGSGVIVSVEKKNVLGYPQ